MPKVTTVGDRVELKKNNIVTYGFIRFVGPIKDKKGTWYGIELDEPKGRNNGSFGNIQYFRCEQNHGLFVKKSFISRTLIPKSMQKRPRVNIGDNVHVISKNCNGIIKYIGTPYTFDNIYYGIELDQAIGNSNGTVNKHWCFDTEPNCAVFVQYDQFNVISEDDDNDGFSIIYAEDINEEEEEYKLPFHSISGGEWRELLVIGFIRSNEAKKFIPNDVVHIIYLYQNLYEMWNDQYSSDDVLIDETKLMITIITKDQPTAFGNEVISSGIFKWRIKIENFSTNKYKVSPFIGVIEDEERYLYRYQDSAFWNEIGYQYCGGNGLLCGMNNYSADCGYTFNKIDDILEMILDLNKFTIRFIINGIDHGIAFKNIKATKYRLALGVSGCKDSQFVLL